MKALLIVDPNVDFFPGGALGVTGGKIILAPLNRMIAYARAKQWLILVSRDWHPPVMPVHFKKWPTHCVQGTRGAEFHPGLDVVGDAIIISKGMKPDEDAYSPFAGFDAQGRALLDVLRASDITDIYFGGLATDYCVKAAGMDGAGFGFRMHLLVDATRAVNVHPDDGDLAIAEMAAAGVESVTVDEVIGEKKT